MKPNRRPQDDQTLDIFDWSPPVRAALTNDNARKGSTFQRVPGGWVEKLVNGRLIAWKAMDGADTMEPTRNGDPI